MPGEDAFPCVHNAIASVLVAPSTLESRSPSWFVRDIDGKISGIRNSQSGPDDVSLDDLVALASQANDLIYNRPPLDPEQPALDPWLEDIRLLSNNTDDHSTSCFMLFLLVTLNCLESSIRSSFGSATIGKAPLLKDMLEAMKKDDTTSNVCKTLLLPSGLNLRNLVWHGFIQEEDALKPWLALILALLQIFRCPPIQQSSFPASILLRNTMYVSGRCRRQLDTVLKEGSRIRKTIVTKAPLLIHVNPTLSSGFIPDTHLPLFRLALDLTRKECPSLASILLVVVLEHSLRLLWCKANNRPHNAVARSGCYYVTLDGHGQRTKHDVILHYDCGSTGSDGTERNDLCGILGGSTISFLTDLFISGCGGPNLRAALAHGVVDSLCLTELRHLVATKTTTGGQKPKHSSLFDTADVLLLAFDLISSALLAESAKKEIRYVPMFSFAATTADSIDDLFAAVAALNELSKCYITDSFLPEVNLADIRKRYEKLVNASAYRSQSVWSVDDLLEERVVNTMLLPLTAARTLLCDTLLAVQTFLADDKCISLEKPRMKAKVFHMSRLACFSMYVALCHMECPSSTDGRKLVERTRMVVSTVVTFIFKNDQRSYKALETFAKGKLTKELIAKIRLE